MYYIHILGAIAISFIISLILGPLIIPLLKRLKIGQSIREDGPQSHLSKSGTPTMGGLIIFASLIITVFSSGQRILTKDIILLTVTTLGFGLIGFLDDYIKIVKHRNLGLRAYQKLDRKSVV